MLLALVACVACDDDEDRKVARRERNLERQDRTREAAQNLCERDEDCAPTGCRGTLCRALPDEGFCSHRLVVALGEDADADALAAALREHLAPSLTPRERDTLTVHPLKRSLLVSFHAPLAQRAELEALLETPAAGGIYLPHPQSDAVVDAVLERAAPVPDALPLSARAADGGPRLLELPIAGGDIVSLSEVRTAALRLEQLLEPHRPPDARLAFEALLEADPPVMRAWLVAPQAGGVALSRLRRLSHEPAGDGERVRVRGELDEEGREALAALTEAARGRALVFVLGRDVLAAPVVGEPVRDGAFELVLDRAAADDTALLEALARLESVPALAGGAWLDRVATADAERDLACWAAQPPLAGCGCVEGHCAWREPAALDACVASGELPAGHRLPE